VVDVFAAYCGPCGPRLKALQALSLRHAQARFAGVSVDEVPDLAHRQTQRFGVTFPVIHDLGRSLSGRLRVRELPITFIVNKRGTIVWVGGPSHTDAQVEQAVVAALNGRLELASKEPTK
jgi:cytochrome c biogenesis protein CcmG, thiol:disulfide interchange protein DsbE